MQNKQRVRQIAVYMAYIMFFSTLQATFPDALRLFGQIADFMLVMVVVSAYFYGMIDGIVVGLSVGLIRDIFSGYQLGIGMLLFMYIGLFAAILFNRLFHRRLASCFLQVAMFTLIYKIVGHTFFFFVAVFSGEHIAYLSLGHIVFESILPQIFVNLLASILIILLFRFLGPYARRTVEQRDETLHYKEGAWVAK